MKMIFVLAAFLFSTNCFAQYVKPDFAALKKNNTDKASALYYPALLKRYMADDTTLTKQEYHQLYYGSAFLKDYSPYGTPDELTELNELFKKDKLSDEDLSKAIALERKSLITYPFRLSTLKALADLYEMKKDNAQSDVMFAKIIGLVRAMSGTGEGHAESTAMYVINVNDEYTIIKLLEYKFGGSQALVNYQGHSLDKMALKENEEGLKFLYFNVDLLFNAMAEMMDKKN